MNAIHETKLAGAATYEQGADGWYFIGEIDAVFDERMCKGIELEGVKIGLFRVDGEIHALDDICTHGAALLTDGEFEGHEVECPLHAGLVDVRTGRALEAPITRDTRHHETRTEADVLYVRLRA
ncbi:non-heme iron oxygenase ferredoxin subunit [Caballeronia cordobensis]|uniref:non-heme iron oxygenase ferredoxin subunit n=1 Tax=Caballeronia cordobensis TaxID=1353886 RepID=UPI0006AD7194|nr:non-heme iron oxygenase ferredoxin subunit [Caballeronia cordobensis]